MYKLWIECSVYRRELFKIAEFLFEFDLCLFHLRLATKFDGINFQFFGWIVVTFIHYIVGVYVPVNIDTTIRFHFRFIVKFGHQRFSYSLIFICIHFYNIFSKSKTPDDLNMIPKQIHFIYILSSCTHHFSILK